MLSIKGNKSSLLKGKKITLCVCGSVAAVRVPELARELIRHGGDVRIVASNSALELVGEQLLEWASENEIVTSLTGKIEHVELGAYADLVIVCPATANTLSKIAMGIDDTPITSTVTCAVGAEKPLIIVPAMHESMYNHPIVFDNMQRLESVGVKVLQPKFSEDKAKLADNSEIVELAISELAEKDLEGTRIVVTAGPTYERIDLVRGITNLSSGKMGIALAKAAQRRGAEVILIHGPTKNDPPSWINTVNVISAEDMTKAVKAAMREGDVLISAAAVADYSPIVSLSEKMKSDKDMALELKSTPKIVSEVRTLYPDKIIIGFKLEKDDLVERAYQKLKKDGLDLIVANHLDAIGAEETDVYIIDEEKRVVPFAGTKSQIAGFVLDAVVGLIAVEKETEQSL